MVSNTTWVVAAIPSNRTTLSSLSSTGWFSHDVGMYVVDRRWLWLPDSRKMDADLYCEVLDKSLKDSRDY